MHGLPTKGVRRSRLWATILVWLVTASSLHADNLNSLPIYHAHPYPICFYDTAPGAVAEANLLWKTYMVSLEMVVRLKERRLTEFVIISSRIAVIKTTINHHRELLNLWPEVACIGETGGATSSNLNRICRQYIANYIQAEIDHTEFDFEGEPICQFFGPE